MTNILYFRKIFVGFLAILAVPVVNTRAQANAVAPAWSNSAPIDVVITFSRQMVLVLCDDWDSTNGVLRRFDRDGMEWKPAAPPNPVSVGRHGLAWGIGLQPISEPGPQKKEGDGRSPAGVFRLSYVFGKASMDDVQGLHMPYAQCTTSLECVDDTKSAYYNQVVDRAKIPHPDWQSSEKMIVPDEYRLGVAVDHDPADQPGAGSCIFLHIWGAPGKPTSGCTAMEAGQLEALVAWLDHDSYPILVQLPKAAYEQFRKSWGLPDVSAPAGGPVSPP